MSARTTLLVLLRAFFSGRFALAAENLALRQQLAILHRQPRPRLRWQDRCFWVVLCWLWKRSDSALLFVQPATVIRWHRQGFRLF